MTPNSAGADATANQAKAPGAPDPAALPDPSAERAWASFRALYNVIVRLRGPGGCPWDQEQDPLSLRGDLVEETYECVEAIDEKDPAHIREELGDLYLLVTMISYMHQEDGTFTVGEVLDGIAEKLIRRHPHVFGDIKVKDSGEVLENWARIKVEQEGRKPKDSILDQVSRGLPPLDRAFRLQKKAARAGFDWPDVEGVMAKVREELEETRAVLAAPAPGESPCAEALEGELGDLIFSAVNLCRYLHVDPSVALQRTNVKFERRFKYVEKKMKENGLELGPENFAPMDRYWEDAKHGDYGKPDPAQAPDTGQPQS
ncbi:MAG: nucleoside triphosphate pyrophosphohydrolase [Treponema sp.]|jgi:tetrapyrrole methylase family protein/MazG family protein|nr:nucleoside triphosphate pyrophosphohydrolase [Treponema sp.]